MASGTGAAPFPQKNRAFKAEKKGDIRCKCLPKRYLIWSDPTNQIMIESVGRIGKGYERLWTPESNRNGTGELARNY